jgi:hypothetical protein
MERLAPEVPGIDPRDTLAIALQVAEALDTQRPLHVPPMPVPSDELAQLLDRRDLGTVPEHMRAEFTAYADAISRRYYTRSENRRRLDTLLWAEQCLRAHGNAEHEFVRAFTQRHWGVRDEASECCAERWAQARDSQP